MAPFPCLAFVLVLVLASAVPPEARALDGSAAVSPDGASYYESSLAGSTLEERETAAGGLPASLSIVDGQGGAAFSLLSDDGLRRDVLARVTLAERPLETVAAVYALVLALPLPITSSGDWGFRAPHGLVVREGMPGQSVAAVYGGEKVVLRRNVGLERAWLPLVVGASAGLPDLGGTGYAYTLWDTVLTHQPLTGATVQGFAELSYSTTAAVALPDPDDDRLAAYLVTWIPTLDPGVPPYTIRLDIAPIAP